MLIGHVIKTSWQTVLEILAFYKYIEAILVYLLPTYKIITERSFFSPTALIIGVGIIRLTSGTCIGIGYCNQCCIQINQHLFKTFLIALMLVVSYDVILNSNLKVALYFLSILS